jgi:hypothetical protein
MTNLEDHTITCLDEALDAIDYRAMRIQARRAADAIVRRCARPAAPAPV